MNPITGNFGCPIGYVSVLISKVQGKAKIYSNCIGSQFICLKDSFISKIEKKPEQIIRSLI